MLKNQKGLSLVELLAGLALLSMIMLLASSIHLFGQKQAISQSAQVQNQSDVRLALKILTKEIRKATSVTVSNNTLTINDTDIYKLEKGNLTKNGVPIISNLKNLSIKMENNKVTLSVTALAASNSPESTLSTVIYTRK
ncbi:PilW family protein [Neobacillus notoginsengisoli]|uniref:PilW family protein n=1 Tax=Neobacillus notoginsengisoli TaxID=1578198 RepID=UPI00131432E2|nr:prepilin-type N-terminal cleavage/methylation domain-containing protein [Neobacillus notoginsengisoli]